MSHQFTAVSHPTSLERALDQNEAIQVTVGQSAAELCVIHAVLQQEVPAFAQTGDVTQALHHTNELEGRIQACADNLEQVNQTLKEEIEARQELEQQLARTEAELAEAQHGAPHSAPARPSAQSASR